LILNLLSNPPSPIGQWAKETLSREAAVAKPCRIKTVFVNWLEKQKKKKTNREKTKSPKLLRTLCAPYKKQKKVKTSDP